METGGQAPPPVAPAAPAAQATPPPPPRKERPPRSPEDLKKMQEKAAVTRQLSALKGCRNVEELHARIAELQGKKAPAKPAVEPAATTAAPPTAAPRPKRDGWPSDENIAIAQDELYPSACQLLQAYPESVRPQTKAFKVRRPKRDAAGNPILNGDQIEMEERLVVVDPAERLARGWAPLAALSLEKMEGTPLRAAIIGTVSVCVMPLVGLGVQLAVPAIKEWWTKRKEAREEAKRAGIVVDQKATPKNGKTVAPQLPTNTAGPKA